jgi:virginiamycin B lyase
MSLRNLSCGVAIAAVLALLASQPAAAAEDRGSVQGIVKDATGKPITGAFVRLKNADRHLTFMVTSQADGRYQLRDLPPGQYSAQGIGGDLQSAIAGNVQVAAGKATSLDVALNNARGPDLTPAWPKRLPEAQIPTVSLDLPAGESQKLVQEKCTICHTALPIVVKRAEREDWEHVIHAMRINMEAAKMPDLAEADAAKIVDYLAATFKPLQPYDPNSRLPRTLMSGNALHYRAVTYDLTDHYAEPHDVASDPAGHAWVAERAGRLGRFDPSTYEFVEKAIPPGPAQADRQHLGNPQIDGQGMLWVADGPNGRWLEYDTKTDKFSAFAWPKDAGHGSARGNSMALSPDGTVWGTGLNKEVRMLNPTTGEWKFFESPSAKSNPGAYGITVAGDGAVWWAEDRADKMARVDPKTGSVEEFKIPIEGEKAYPRRMNIDANGDVWVALWNASKLMKIDHKTKAMKIYTPPAKTGGNYSVVVDKKNNLVWVSEHQVDMIARFDPKAETWAEFPLPEAESDPRRIDIDPTNHNRIYFSGDTAGRVGFVELVE